MSKYDVFAVGNALVDIQARVPDSTVIQLGVEKGVMTLVDDQRQTAVIDSLGSVELNRCAGGSAANSIVGIAEFGGAAAFVGKVGDDVTGEFFLRDMRDLGIDVEVVPSQAGPTGTCAVLITEDAQRTMLTNLGASTTLTEADIDVETVKQSSYVYVEGYLLTGPTTKAAAQRVMSLAVEHGTKVAFTASDPFLVNMIREELWDLLTGPVDLFFCNEEEAKSLTGEDDPIQAAAKIHEHCENVCLTLGEKGSIVMHGGQALPIEGVPVEAIDTTGAGDMYAAGILYGITNGMSWDQAGRLASHASARIVAQMGARLDQKFTTDEIESFSKSS